MLLIASDHGGLELKNRLIDFLRKRGIEVRDLGTDNGDSVDYPDFGVKVAETVASGKADKGILICGTGIGMSIVANKFPGIRAALIWDEFTARMSKEHNDANVIVLGGRTVDGDKACEMVGIWLDTDFAGGRHQQRLDKIARIEDDIRSRGIDR